MQQRQQPNLIAQTALNHYLKVLPKNKGKPQPSQWTVYAAIVATKNAPQNNDDDTAGNPAHEGKQKEAWVVSCATGSKCTTVHPALNHFGTEHIPQCVDVRNKGDTDAISFKFKNLCREKCCTGQMKGFVLRDSHAEVVARRGLVRVLWEEILYHLKIGEENENSNDIETKHQQKSLLKVVSSDTSFAPSSVVKENTKIPKGQWSFELKHDINLHLYISDSPCGDASIYDIAQKYATNINKESTHGMTYTGAKIILSNEDEVQSSDNFFQCSDMCSRTNIKTAPQKDQSHEQNVNIAREKVQIKSALRLKSGRSDIPSHLRSSSMSCSDKICKWIVFGLQGCGALAKFIPNGIYLNSIVVSCDPRIECNGDGLLDSQLESLKRALINRASSTISTLASTMERNNSNKVNTGCKKYLNGLHLPSVHVCDQIFFSGKAVMEKQTIDEQCNESLLGTHQSSATTAQTDPEQNHKKRKMCNEQKSNIRKRQKGMKISSCGISLNWQDSFESKIMNSKNSQNIEQVVGSKGILQRKKPKSSNDIINSVSRLSRYSLNSMSIQALRLAGFILDNSEKSREKLTYQQIKEKHAPGELKKIMKLAQIDCKNPLQGWVKSSSEYDFSVCSQPWRSNL